jgi:hypothetical protein
MKRLRHARDWAPGERTDGSIDIFPLSELPARLAEVRAWQRALDEWSRMMPGATLDDLGDLFDRYGVPWRRDP